MEPDAGSSNARAWCGLCWAEGARLLLISMRRTHVRRQRSAAMECIVDEEQLRLYVFSASSAKLKNRYANVGPDWTGLGGAGLDWAGSAANFYKRNAANSASFAFILRIQMSHKDRKVRMASLAPPSHTPNSPPFPLLPPALSACVRWFIAKIHTASSLASSTANSSCFSFFFGHRNLIEVTGRQASPGELWRVLTPASGQAMY